MGMGSWKRMRLVTVGLRLSVLTTVVMLQPVSQWQVQSVPQGHAVPVSALMQLLGLCAEYHLVTVIFPIFASVVLMSAQKIGL